MRDSLSSVETSSFSQLEIINSRGVYQIGAIRCDSGLAPHDYTLDKCLKVEIASDENEAGGTVKSYSYSFLQDLESKLMLICGQNHQHRNTVDMFVEVLSRTVRLANVFIDLANAGHDAYLQWTKSFSCCSVNTRGFSISLDTSDEDMDGFPLLLEKMGKEADEMKECLKNWVEKVEIYRKQYSYLNFFTTPQVLVLRRELGLVVANARSTLPNDVFSLLMSVRPNCNFSDVKEALGVVRGYAAAQNIKPIFRQGVAEPTWKEKDVQLLQDMGFARRRALRSLQLCDGDPERALTMCLDYGDQGVMSDVEDMSVGDVTFAEPTVSSVTTMMSGVVGASSYLSMDVLGQILQLLAPSSPQPLKRSFSICSFRAGEPNLISAPRNEVLPTVLELYMIDTRMALPTAHEVLLCSSSTSIEEVCLLWRRAIADPTRLFCLAMADKLSYEVSQKSWEKINEFMHSYDISKPVDFKFAVVCSAEKDDKSYLVNALETYRRHTLPSPSARHLQKYFKAIFIQKSKEVAASLDTENSSVRVVRSSRAGVGKTSFVKAMADRLGTLSTNRCINLSPVTSGEEKVTLHVMIPLHEKDIDVDDVVKKLRPFCLSPDRKIARIIHIDVSPLVCGGVDSLVFNLLILGQLSDTKGNVWRKQETDMYVIEITRSQQPLPGYLTPSGSVIQVDARLQNTAFSLIDCLPTTLCTGPVEVLQSDGVSSGMEDAIVDHQFRSCDFQRVYQYLLRLSAAENLDRFKFQVGTVEGSQRDCLAVLLQNCGVSDPSWSEIKRFVSFLSHQLRDCDHNDFCNPVACGEDLPGFKQFVLKLMIRMSIDFAAPSLNVHEPALTEKVGILEKYQLRRRWEHSPHPYLFFNEDRQSVSFFGVKVNRQGQLQDPNTDEVLDPQLISPQLCTALYIQGFRLEENYDQWDKARKINELCRVMGVQYPFDHDESYELTMDNVKKILAIHMRFRCGIPVVVMGETGCGKTRLIKYMCKLQSNLTGAKNMLLMKVHGGVTNEDITNKVLEAERLAEHNEWTFPGYKIQTVLFFDEANTTDALGLIKEIMCDGRLNGRKISHLGTSLQIIAACNPYRKHTDDMIQRLEAAGLGFHVRAEDTDDRLGRIPLRQLVYRVHPLPASMTELVWDFGQLNPGTEKLYIRQIVARHVKQHLGMDNADEFVNVLVGILATAQCFMRDRNDECSFVSLRDVERAMIVICWFYDLRDVLRPLVHKKCSEHVVGGDPIKLLSSLTRSVVLALAVCYHARLKDRKPFREVIAKQFQSPCNLHGGANRLDQEIRVCQEVFLDELEFEPQIARNHALSENVFMMLVCIDLRIPLFLVGKPGSSKSLAKDIVKTNMKGHLSHSKLLRSLKQLHMASYQCSPLSTAEGIIGVFEQCQRLQNDNDEKRYVSCVVLDEVGLAEDSPRLPLKALHPLLDDGTTGADSSEEDDKAARVAFVGLSNWALDPAKMNRGILVNREEPDDDDLIFSAKGICSSDDQTLDLLMPYLEGMAKAYRRIYGEQKEIRSEFFGLRDYYSLVKMLYGFCKQSQRQPTRMQIEHAIRRNFGGQDDVDVLRIFYQCCNLKSNTQEQQSSPTAAIDNTTIGLIRAATETGRSKEAPESRYVLLLTDNYAALNIVRQQVLLRDDAVIIFGSGFPKDQEYGHICRTINRIKVCMATGRAVVLLNLDKLYESLYDALNQYYVRLGGQKFVDLGLGSHRVKCQVHEDFRLILVAERDAVYKYFPIPLINRMEKHCLSINSVLSHLQKQIVERVKVWVQKFSVIKSDQSRFETGNEKQNHFKETDAFIGYHKDAVATIVLQSSREIDARKVRGDALESEPETSEDVFHLSCEKFLCCATPDSIARLPASDLSSEAEAILSIYYEKLPVSNLADFVKFHTSNTTEDGADLLMQVTTHSRLFSFDGITDFGNSMKVEGIALQQFDTEQQFCNRIKELYNKEEMESSLLAVQCELGEVSSDMISCARYLIQEAREEGKRSRKSNRGHRHLVLIVQVSRMSANTFTGFQGGFWIEAHIDDLRQRDDHIKMPSVRQLTNRTMSSLLLAAIDDDYSQRPPVEPSAPPLEEVMEVDDSQEIVSEEGVAMEVDSNPDMLYNNQTLLDSYDLIQACIHGAVSRLDDPEADVEKTSQRIRVLLSLTETSECCRDSETFSRELVRRISKLLKEKETRMDPHAAAGWVRNEALSHRSIQAGGTFKRALWLRIVDVVTPILSEILALLDSNSNLSLMRDGFSKDGSWIRTLWLDLFCCPHFGQLSYDNFVSPVQGQIRQRVTVASSGYRGQSFMSKFPFSNLVKNELDEMMQKASNLSESSHERLDIALQRLVASSTVGRILSETIENSGANKDNLIRRYLHDFVRMVYKASSAKEYELVESAIECGVKEMASLQPLTDEIIDVSLTLSTIHASFQHVRRRLYLFRDMIRNRSDIVKHLHRETRGAGEEMVIDGVAAGLLLEELSTKVKHTSNERRRDWLRLMQVTKSIMESWLTVPLSDLPQQSARKALTLDIRTTWSVLSVVALFAEHIQHLSPDPFLETVCLKFYQCLCSVDIDFTRVHTIQAVQRFLDKINKEFGEKLLKCNEQCAICLDAWTEKEPARLPCGHAYCYECIKPHIRGRPVCPTCQLRVPETYDCRSDDNLKLASIRYREFKRSITAFFMELVSVWSFSETAAGPPDRELVHLLLELVVQKRLPHLEGPRTRPFSPFEEDTFDSRPVVRSFLLQLLLKYSARLTIDYVSRIFHEAQAFLGSSRIEGVDDLSVIFVQCMEDALERKACLSSAANWSQLVSSELRLSVERLNPSAQPVDRLLGIAGLRFSLAALSAIVVDILRDDEFEHQSRYNFLSSQSKLRPHEIETLISKAKEACNAVNDPQVVLFFLKQLVRRHGMDIIQKMRDRPHLAWICDIGQMDDATVPDFFAVTQFPYLDVRKAVAEVLLTGDVEYLKRMLKESRKRSRNAVLSAMLLAFYTEVTLKTTRNQPQLQIVQSIEESLGEDKRIPEWCKCLASDLLHNAQGRRLGRLEVSRGQSIQHLSLSGLALHIFVALSFSRRSNLIEPLRLILTEPQNMTNSYFPTMPEDVYIEARELVAGTKWYQCKNGHPYLVADCGRPVVSFQCTDCNEPIGDRTRDADARTHDTTQTGHILGPANQRAHAAPERSLSLSGYALVRLLLHAALMWASCSEDQNVSSGVADCTSPRVNENDLPEYFWSHFVHDVEVFSKTIGRSVQDAVVVCHEMLKRIVIGGEKAADTQVGTRLTSKNERKTWESLINQKLISPLLQSIPADIDEWLQRVMNDKCSVNNPVLRQVYELENPSASRFSSQLWRYRVRVSIEHLVNAIDQTLDPGQPTHCSLLKEFFAEESKLRALQYLPDILKLQTILATKCNRRFSQQEALTMTVDDFIRSLDDPERQMFTKLLDSFVAAWQQVKEKVLNHGRLKPKKTKEHELQNVCGQTPIAFLLPRTQDEGTCALALVDYLINCTHNEFMGKYRRITGNEREAERVSMADMTVAHLIAYDVERDLMPLIFAHCDYTLAVGEGTKITYNLLALERQIADRFIVGKPHIDMEVCSVSYRKDVYNMALFARLTQRVTQEDLDASAERQIVAEMRDLRDIYSVLALLDIVIGFLASSGGEEDMTLDHYVHETLRMPRASSLISNKARQVCQLKHVRALWRLLNVEKSKRLTLADREPFEGVSPKYRHRLGKSARESLKIALKKIRIDVFLTELVDVVILELEKWQETSNIEEYELAAALEELHGSTMGGLNEISGDVKLKHIVHCWSLAVKLQAQMTRV
ncbi:E3 ubiquitin-protein ligase rnf213-alpha-like isoform X2 [Corticium candelabrum]|uniref:E3 ubiquitin-protein ligase rnf213-alpha-like isoform X2 n=1 Tax=Corticium candelabrum TaxID=121492 RepID=UPI002E31AE8A|nr:E3 ubiquitin-protein ligase rnf213-alpha-like isoform X2 [Corticium candelabrum]